jgi:hypothetical protein
LVAGRWTLDAGRWTLDAGRWTLDAGRWTLYAGFMVLLLNLCFSFFTLMLLPFVLWFTDSLRLALQNKVALLIRFNFWVHRTTTVSSGT